jgi:hypothetical protein
MAASQVQISHSPQNNTLILPVSCRYPPIHKILFVRLRYTVAVASDNRVIVIGYAILSPDLLQQRLSCKGAPQAVQILCLPLNTERSTGSYRLPFPISRATNRSCVCPLRCHSWRRLEGQCGWLAGLAMLLPESILQIMLFSRVYPSRYLR